MLDQIERLERLKVSVLGTGGVRTRIPSSWGKYDACGKLQVVRMDHTQAA